MNEHSVRWVVSVALATLAWSTTRSADACTGPLALLCRGARADAAPANAQAIAFRSVYDRVDSGGVLLWSMTAPTVEVTDASESPVEVSVSPDPNIEGWWVIRPATPLTAGGKYKVQWQPLCSAEAIQSSTNYGNADPTQAEIIVPNAAPVPSSLGTATIVLAPQRRAHNVTSCDSGEIAKPFEEVVARVRLDQDPSFVPYADVATVQMTIDGAVIEQAPYRLRYTDGFGALIASCDPTVDTGISPAEHTVGFRAFVIGIETPLTAETTVNFSCASTPEASSGSSGSEANGPADDADQSGGPTGGDSCAFSTAPRGWRVGPLALLALVACGLRRRRTSTSR